jgi:hypothetical protein
MSRWIASRRFCLGWHTVTTCDTRLGRGWQDLSWFSVGRTPRLSAGLASGSLRGTSVRREPHRALHGIRCWFHIAETKKGTPSGCGCCQTVCPIVSVHCELTPIIPHATCARQTQSVAPFRLWSRSRPLAVAARGETRISAWLWTVRCHSLIHWSSLTSSDRRLPVQGLERGGAGVG